MQSGEEAKGYRLATMSSAALTAVMGVRFYKTRKPMPAGALAALGAASLAYHGTKYWDEYQ